MKLKNITLTKFRRFEALTLDKIPPVKMVILAGPNGSGKSSLFDAFSAWLQANYVGLNWDPTYHSRDKSAQGWSNQVSLEFHSGTPCNKSIYLRSAYRNDPDFQISNLSKQTDPVTSALSAGFGMAVLGGAGAGLGTISKMRGVGKWFGGPSTGSG